MFAICLESWLHEDLSLAHHDRKDLDVYVVRQRDRLLSCQLCGVDAPRFPPGGEGMRLMEP